MSLALGVHKIYFAKKSTIIGIFLKEGHGHNAYSFLAKIARDLRFSAFDRGGQGTYTHVKVKFRKHFYRSNAGKTGKLKKRRLLLKTCLSFQLCFARVHLKPLPKILFLHGFMSPNLLFRMLKTAAIQFVPLKSYKHSTHSCSF
jgi:hypothetical protein